MSAPVREQPSLLDDEPGPRVWTIGHSTRTLEEFVALLSGHGITALADVRRFPQSRRHPHFSAVALEASLRAHGIAYHHFPGLGGRRSAARGAAQTAWQHPAFDAYAQYMNTPEFDEALGAVVALAAHERVAIMCAEAQWWRCHRRLIADALVARTIPVRHIMSARRAPPHELTSFAALEGSRVCYPRRSPTPIDV